MNVPAVSHCAFYVSEALTSGALLTLQACAQPPTNRTVTRGHHPLPWSAGAREPAASTARRPAAHGNDSRRPALGRPLARSPRQQAGARAALGGPGGGGPGRAPEPRAPPGGRTQRHPGRSPSTLGGALGARPPPGAAEPARPPLGLRLTRPGFRPPGAVLRAPALRGAWWARSRAGPQGRSDSRRRPARGAAPASAGPGTSAPPRGPRSALATWRGSNSAPVLGPATCTLLATRGDRARTLAAQRRGSGGAGGLVHVSSGRHQGPGERALCPRLLCAATRWPWPVGRVTKARARSEDVVQSCCRRHTCAEPLGSISPQGPRHSSGAAGSEGTVTLPARLPGGAEPTPKLL